jgi:hypothetical protein
MANASWPSSLPQYVLEQGYTEALADQFIETSMDAGSPKRRRRFTRENRQFSISLACTDLQSQVFEQFYDIMLGGGSLPFDWVHPRLRTAITFAIRHPVPRVTQQGGKFIWSFAVEALTDPIFTVAPGTSPSVGQAAGVGAANATSFQIQGRSGVATGTGVAAAR